MASLLDIMTRLQFHRQEVKYFSHCDYDLLGVRVHLSLSSPTESDEEEG